MSSVKRTIHKTIIKLALVVIAAIGTWLVSSRPTIQAQNLLTVDYLDVGQGDSELITTPSGYQILIDGGPTASVLTQLNQVMDASDHSIDMVMLSHPDADHLAGLVDVLRDYEVKTILMPDVGKDTNIYKAWVKAINAEGAQIHVIQDAQTFTLPDNLIMTILSPTPETYHQGEPANNASIIARLDYGERSFLFTGDEEQIIEGRLLANEATKDQLDVDVLKSPHHGSKTSSSGEFLAAVSPQIVVIEVGKDNKYGHPSPIVIDRYERQYSRIFRTDQLGRIRLTTDGHVITWPKPCNPLQSLLLSCASENVYNATVKR